MTELINTAVRGLTVRAAEGDDPQTGKRIVEGVAVQYGVVARVSNGWLVRFEPGSLGDPDSVKLRRDHEYPIGIVSSWKDTESERRIVAKVSHTSQGDDALALAEDGVLDGLSVGVQPVEYSFEASDEHGGEEVMVVAKGMWRETSLVEFGAFPGAKVTKVAASAAFPQSTNNKEATVADTNNTVEATAPATDPAISEALDKIAAATSRTSDLLEAMEKRDAEQPATVPVTATGAPPRNPFKNAGDYAFNVIRAQRGDDVALDRIKSALDYARAAAPEAMIEAALDETTTALNTGLIPPVYTSNILGGLPVSTPILDLLVRHEALPPTGMSIIKPDWSVLPEGDWISTENTEPASDAVAVATATTNVLTWGHAVKASVNLLERSAFGGFAQAYFNQAVISFRSDAEAKAKTQMFTDATSFTASDVDAPLTVIGELVEHLIDQQDDANGNFRGLPPDFVGVAANNFTKLTKVATFLPFVQGNVSWGTMMGNVAGLTVVLLPSLNNGDYIAGARAATVVYDDTPMQLRATVVNTMSVELGVIANFAVDVEYPNALSKVTFGS